MNAVQAAVRSVRLATKAAPVGTVAPGAGRVMRIRDRHHMIARLVSTGMAEEDIAKACGCTLRYLEMLTEQTPAFIQLVAEYRAKAGRVNAALDTYIDHLERNMITAEMLLHEKLMDDEADLTVSELHKIARDAADRLGYSKRTVNFNVNLDLADRLEAARKRSGQLRELPSATPSQGQQDFLAVPVLESVALPVVVEEAVSSAESVSSPPPEPIKGLLRRRL